MNELTAVKNMRRHEYFKKYFHLNGKTRFWIGSRLTGENVKLINTYLKIDLITVVDVKSRKVLWIPKETQVERIPKRRNS